MIHHDILHTIKKERQHESFIYPYYGEYSIAEIPPSILEWFGKPNDRHALPFASRFNHGYKQVLFFFIDGFGFDHFVDYEDTLPFFHRLATKGDVYPLTSTFPSTTPAALTTLHTNRTPQEHGLPEWTVYFEEFDRIIEPLPFRAQFTHDADGLLAEGGTPEMLYDGPSFYQTLGTHGVKSYVFISEAYAESTYSSVSQRGAIIVPFGSAEDLARKMLETIGNEKDPAYFFVYWAAVDSTEHAFGPRSKEHLQALGVVNEFLEDTLHRKLPPEQARDMLFLLSSDHGQASIRNEDIIYLNDYVDLEQSYTWGASKRAIYPTGAPHDVFLYIYEPKREAIIRYLCNQLAGKAAVLTTKEAVERGLFGRNQPSERFLKRIGDVVILPYEGYHVWFKHAPDATFGQLGIHGGLSQREMIVPLAIAPMRDLLT